MDGAFLSPRGPGNLAHGLPGRHGDRHLALRSRQPQGQGHQGRVKAGRQPRFDQQDQHGHVPHPVVRRGYDYRLDMRHDRRPPAGRCSSIVPLTAGRADGSALAIRPVSWAASAGTRAHSSPPRSTTPAPCRSKARARSLASMICPRRSRWRTPSWVVASRSVRDVPSASVSTSVCRTRTNCGCEAGVLSAAQAAGPPSPAT